jgi:hypothetical protein
MKLKRQTAPKMTLPFIGAIFINTFCIVTFFIANVLFSKAVQAVDVAIPVYAQIVKNQTGSGLAIRADMYSFQGTYLNNSFNDISINFDVVQLTSAAPLITQYQMTILELVHYCSAQGGVIADREEIFPITRIDSLAIAKDDILTGNTFDQSDAEGAYRQHKMLLNFPVITQESYEQSCNGIIAISVAEQI